MIQPFQQPERVIGFFNIYRDHRRVSQDTPRDIAIRFHGRVKNRTHTWGIPILDAPDGRRDEFVEPYFKRAQPDDVVVILQAREPARILLAIGNRRDDRWRVQFAQRWVAQYSFYVTNLQWGRMFVRLCPSFPLTARDLNHLRRQVARPVHAVLHRAGTGRGRLPASPVLRPGRVP